MISSTASTSDDFLRCSKDVRVGRRCNEGYDLSLLGLLYNLMSNGSADNDEAQQYHVNYP